MKLTVLQKESPFFDEKDVLRSIGMPEDHHFAGTIRTLLEETKAIAKPKAFYMECAVEKVAAEAVVIDGVTFLSSFLADHLKEQSTVYPYLCTCGKELASFALSLTGMEEKYAFDAIMNFYQKMASFFVESALVDKMPEGCVPEKDNPGDLPDWNIREQRKLFDLFGSAAAGIGVELSPKYMMFPLKSVSGIFYPAEDVWENCKCCQRRNCGRRKTGFSERAYLESLYLY